MFDSQGKLVRTITGIRQDQVEIDREDLGRGLYFFRLQSAKASGTGKLLFVD